MHSLCSFLAVALFLDDQWYAVDDILRTADPAREGLIKVAASAEGQDLPLSDAIHPVMKISWTKRCTLIMDQVYRM